MKVLDVLTESEKVNEGPLRFLKRTLGKNTAMGKSAQLDVEIDKEVKNIYKDYVAVSKQDPKKQGMTVDSLSRFLAAKGFVNSPKEVVAFIKQDTSLAKKLGRGAVAGGKKTIDATKKGATAVIDAGKKIKQKMASKSTGLTPDQPNLPGIESMSESVLLEQSMSGSEVKKVIKRFVQQGFQKQLGGRVRKSAYATDTGDNMMPTDDIQTALDTLRNAGFTIDDEKKKIKAPA